MLWYLHVCSGCLVTCNFYTIREVEIVEKKYKVPSYILNRNIQGLQNLMVLLCEQQMTWRTWKSKTYEKKFCILSNDIVCFWFQTLKRLEKARQKAETVTDSVDISDKAKMKQIKEWA